MSSWLSRNSANPLTPSRKFSNSNEAINNDTATPTNMKTDGTAPTFQKKPSIRHAEEGKLVFECLIESEPQPVVKWFHNGQPLQLNSRFKVSHLAS